MADGELAADVEERTQKWLQARQKLLLLEGTLLPALLKAGSDEATLESPLQHLRAGILLGVSLSRYPTVFPVPELDAGVPILVSSYGGWVTLLGRNISPGQTRCFAIRCDTDAVPGDARSLGVLTRSIDEGRATQLALDYIPGVAPGCGVRARAALPNGAYVVVCANGPLLSTFHPAAHAPTQAGLLSKSLVEAATSLDMPIVFRRLVVKVVSCNEDDVQSRCRFRSILAAGTGLGPPLWEAPDVRKATPIGSTDQIAIACAVVGHLGSRKATFAVDGARAAAATVASGKRQTQDVPPQPFQRAPPPVIENTSGAHASAATPVPPKFAEGAIIDCTKTESPTAEGEPATKARRTGSPLDASHGVASVPAGGNQPAAAAASAHGQLPGPAQHPGGARAGSESVRGAAPAAGPIPSPARAASPGARKRPRDGEPGPSLASGAAADRGSQLHYAGGHHGPNNAGAAGTPPATGSDTAASPAVVASAAIGSAPSLQESVRVDGGAPELLGRGGSGPEAPSGLKGFDGDALMLAAFDGSLEVVVASGNLTWADTRRIALARDCTGSTVLHWAVRGCHVGLVSRLVQHPFSIPPHTGNVHGETPLHDACRTASVPPAQEDSAMREHALVEVLLAAQGSLLLLAQPSHTGWTPVALAAAHGNAAALASCLERQPNLALRNTPLWSVVHHAAAVGSVETWKAIVRTTSSWKQKSQSGSARRLALARGPAKQSPLEIAVRHGHLRLIVTMLEHAEVHRARDLYNFLLTCAIRHRKPLVVLAAVLLRAHTPAAEVWNTLSARIAYDHGALPCRAFLLHAFSASPSKAMLQWEALAMQAGAVAERERLFNLHEDHLVVSRDYEVLERHLASLRPLTEAGARALLATPCQLAAGYQHPTRFSTSTCSVGSVPKRAAQGKSLREEMVAAALSAAGLVWDRGFRASPRPASGRPVNVAARRIAHNLREHERPRNKVGDDVLAQGRFPRRLCVPAVPRVADGLVWDSTRLAAEMWTRDPREGRGMGARVAAAALVLVLEAESGPKEGQVGESTRHGDDDLALVAASLSLLPDDVAADIVEDYTVHTPSDLRLLACSGGTNAADSLLSDLACHTGHLYEDPTLGPRRLEGDVLPRSRFDRHGRRMEHDSSGGAEGFMETPNLFAIAEDAKARMVRLREAHDKAEQTWDSVRRHFRAHTLQLHSESRKIATPPALPAMRPATGSGAPPSGPSIHTRSVPAEFGSAAVSRRIPKLSRNAVATAATAATARTAVQGRNRRAPAPPQSARTRGTPRPAELVAQAGAARDGEALAREVPPSPDSLSADMQGLMQVRALLESVKRLPMFQGATPAPVPLRRPQRSQEAPPGPRVQANSAHDVGRHATERQAFQRRQAQYKEFLRLKEQQQRELSELLRITQERQSGMQPQLRRLMRSMQAQQVPPAPSRAKQPPGPESGDRNSS